MDNQNSDNDDIFAELGLPSLNAKETVKPKPAAPQPEASEDIFADLGEESEPMPETAPEIEEAAPAPRAAAPSAASRLKAHSQNVPLSLAAVIAKKSIALKEVVQLKAGDVVSFSKNPQDLIDLVANGKLIAKGELVLVDGKVAVQIRQLIG